MIKKKTFVVIELILGAAALVLLALMFGRNTQTKTVAVIVRGSEDARWASFFYGIRQGAADEDLKVIIEDTETEMTAEEEKGYIGEVLDEGADALIVEALGESDAAFANADVPVIRVSADGHFSGGKSENATASFDGNAMGRALANEIRRDYEGNLSGKTIGILGSTSAENTVSGCETGFTEEIAGSGAAVLWTIHTAEDAAEKIAEEEAVDFIVALDTTSCESAGSAAADGKAHGALVYGIGNSVQAVYYLDQQLLRGMVVPDGFSLGYKSTEEIAKHLAGRFYKINSVQASYKYIRPSDIFLEENQMLLFADGTA